MGGSLTTQAAESPLLAVARGEPGAVRACIDEYGSLVWSLARRWLTETADAEDAVQDIFIDLWQSAGRFDPTRASGHGFVAMVARRRLIDRQRKAGRRPRLQGFPKGFDASSDAHERFDDVFESERIMEALGTLRAEHRQFVELSFLNGYSHAEIAERTGAPLGTVKSAIRRSLLQLRDVLGTSASGSPEAVQ